MKLFVLAYLFALAQARPQDFPSADEVELIPPVRDDSAIDGDSVEGGRPVVVIVRGGLPSLPRLPGIGGFFNSVPGFSDFPFQADSVPRIPSIFGLDGVPGGAVDDSDAGEPVCGPLCQMFKVIQGLQGEIDEIHNQMGGNGPNFFNGGNQSFFDGDFDINNSTYEEKELEDGTKIKINRTVLADTDDNGNQFFFHSSVLHNFGGDGPDSADVDLVPVVEESPEEEADPASEADSDDEAETIEAIPDSDPAFNEINDDIQSDEFPPSDEFGVDSGLQQ